MAARHRALHDNVQFLLRRSRPARLRSMHAFAEQEIIIPDGPYKGRPFRCSRQPYSGLFLDAVDSGLWNRFVATGPTQSGKTTTCYVIPLLYHLFECGETVIGGIPDMYMALDKWTLDILPVIEASRYRELLPTTGVGSRGGMGKAIRFKNGAVLRWMTGGGGDKARAGFTSRVVVITETDGMDEPGAASREADKITQIEARTRAFGSRARIYMECTVSVEGGRTWRELKAGTDSSIAICCPRCQVFVVPERKHLTGWENAENELQAKQQARFHCPSCGAPWSDDERVQANQKALVVHRGQHIEGRNGSAKVVGPLPETTTLGFRWDATNNLFVCAGDVGIDEWSGAQSPDDENAEKELRQFVWALPYQPPALDLNPLTTHALVRRSVGEIQGKVPADAVVLTIGVDLGKYLCHYMVVAWKADGSGHVVYYGRFEVASDQLGIEKALLAALRQFRDEVCLIGFAHIGEENRLPDQVWVDAGWKPEVVYAFCNESGDRFRACRGFGTDSEPRRYSRPRSTGNVICYIGDGYHVCKMHAHRAYLFEVDADQWKSFVHARLNTPVGEPGSLTLYQALPREHFSLSKHLTAERQVEEFVPGRGTLVKWQRLRRNNHWFDALYLAAAAAHLCGVRLVAGPGPGAPAAATVAGVSPGRDTGPADRLEEVLGRLAGSGPFVATDR